MKNRKQIFTWALYDFANTSYSIIVVTFLYAVYFKKVIASGKPEGDFYWSLGTGIAMIITALLSPVLGAIADYSAGKKRFLLFFTAVCITATASLYFTGEGTIVTGLLLFIIANIGFEAGLVFYDAFLPEITTPKNYGRVSGYGFAMGYFGSLTVLAIVYPLIISEQIRETFPVAALFFLAFSLPLFIFLQDNRKEGRKSYGELISIGFSRVYETIKHLPSYKNLSYFLLAYFLYIEGVNTVIFFAGNYASTSLGFDEKELLLFFISVQSTAILGSVVLGIIADSIGQKRTIMISLAIWVITVVLAYYTTDKQVFYIVGFLAGICMGSSQSISRSLMSALTPPERKTEFFGFFSFFGKSSAIVGPLVFGYTSYVTGDQRLAILTVAFFFIAGMVLLTKVKEPSPQQSELLP